MAEPLDTSTLQHLLLCWEQVATDRRSIAELKVAHSRGPAQKRATSAVSLAEHEAQLVDDACNALSDITFGAQAGLLRRYESSLADYIGKYARDLGSAIEMTARFHDVVSPVLGWALDVSGNAASLELFWKDTSFAKHHRYAEFAIYAALARIRATTQSDFNPIELRIPHEVGSSEQAFRKLAGCPMIFRAEELEIVMPLSALDRAIPTYDGRLHDHLVAYGERLLDELGQSRQPLRSQVEGLLIAAWPVRTPDAREVAKELGMSTRTLSRKLKANGASFNAIVEDLRRDLANTLLQDDLSLSEISLALGYSNQAAFSSAFRRWNGLSPSQYRAMR